MNDDIQDIKIWLFTLFNGNEFLLYFIGFS